MSSTPVNRKAKIVATIGPSSQEKPVLRQLIDAGIDVARLNFSHGTHAEHQEKIESIRRLSAEFNKPVSILDRKSVV
jgi:pyruvate kinase